MRPIVSFRAFSSPMPGSSKSVSGPDNRPGSWFPFGANLHAMVLVIRRSNIHADGVYTTRSIKKGTIVAEYTGPRLTNAEADAIYEHSPRTYLFGMTDGEHVIDGDGIAAFINHSCNPNCEADEIKGRVVIRAIRNIAAGEELAYDYNLYDGDVDDPALCFCGTNKCRGSMYSQKELRRRGVTKSSRLKA